MDIVNKKSYATPRKIIERRAIKFDLNLLNYFHDSINSIKIMKKLKFSLL